MADPDETPPQGIAAMHPANGQLVRELMHLARTLTEMREQVRQLGRQVWHSPIPVDQSEVARMLAQWFQRAANSMQDAGGGKKKMIVSDMRGLAELGDAGGASTSKLIWWPSDIKALASQTDTEIVSLASDYDRAGTDSDTLAAFNTFYNEWVDYHADLGVFSYLSGGTVGTLQEYRLRASQWRDKLLSTGAQVSSPAPKGLPDPSTASPWASSLRWVAGAAIAVAAVYGISQVVGIVRTVAPTPLRANPRRRRRGRARRRSRR